MNTRVGPTLARRPPRLRLGRNSMRDRITRWGRAVRARGGRVPCGVMPASPRVAIDTVFFQMYQTGIARVWTQLLRQWLADGLGEHLVVLDRAYSAPKFEGVRYRSIAAYDYANADADKWMLQRVCDEEGIDVFASTYYT